MRGLLTFLHVAYFPFVGFVGFFQLALGVLGILAGSLSETGDFIIYWFFAVVFLLLFGWFLVPMWIFLTWKPDPKWIMEMKVSREDVPFLYDLMDDVARRCELPAADEIRLSPSTVAAVFQTKGGRQVLLLGALTIAAFPPEVVSAIIAHELAHIEGGDTAALREMELTRKLMIIVRAYFMTHPWGYLHPFVWAVFLYQWFFELVFASTSREQEFEADQASVDQAGPEDTAVGLFYAHVTPMIPDASFDDLLMAVARTRDFERKAFTHQVHRVRAASRADWKKAMRRALAQNTRLFDDHPCLGARLDAIGVDPEEAFEWARHMEGEPTSLQIDRWPELERKLTIRVLVPYLQTIEDKKDVAAILAGPREK